ncbi:hypothetical protein [Amycolatopsis sp. cg13]|uniref:hypothetical protein n=1 Tax=Amycolatopsis sp. cg13 TaxID=3238807 RepID=UPI003525E98C
MSAALAKLRRHFGDELLTRVGNHYQLTPFAEQLRPWVSVAVERVFSAQPPPRRSAATGSSSARWTGSSCRTATWTCRARWTCSATAGSASSRPTTRTSAST